MIFSYKFCRKKPAGQELVMLDELEAMGRENCGSNEIKPYDMRDRIRMNHYHRKYRGRKNYTRFFLEQWNQCFD